MRRDAGLSPGAERELRCWLAADPRYQAAFDRLTRTWAVFDRAEKKGLAPGIVTRLEASARRRRTLRRSVGAVAAIALLAAGIGLWPRPASAPAPFGNLAFEPVRKLPDGSIVELNAGADIAVQYETGTRRVRLLKGEAHFRVEKDASRPFIVEAGKVAVRAVGTAFTVQLQTGKVEVVVTEGRVSVEPEAAGSPVAEDGPAVSPPTLVSAGNHALVDLSPHAESPPQVAPLTETQLDERLAWRIPRLEFGGMELGQAIALMNRQNRLQITLADAGIDHLRISGTFRADNPEGFVRIVGDAFGLQVERPSDDEIVLRKK
jgi:transmembrane sensor